MKHKPTLTSLAPAWLALTIPILGLSTAMAQNTLFTYQGRVTDNGTNFNGAGQFKFALVSAVSPNTPAVAGAVTLSPPNGGIASIAVAAGGSGYTTAPTVTISAPPPGSGATATATLGTGGLTGSVIGINIITGGSSYASGTVTVTIAPPPTNSSYKPLWFNDVGGITGTPPSQPAAAVTVTVSNGLFNVVLGDTTLSNMSAIPLSLLASSVAANGLPNLSLQIWFNDGVNGFAALSPVQPLTPTPYSAYAVAAAATSQTNFTGSFSGDGSGLTGVTGTQGPAGPTGPQGPQGPAGATGATGPAGTDGWSTNGNAGTTAGANYIGTKDNQPLEFHVNGVRALRLEPDTNSSGEPNVIGGAAANTVSGGVVGGTIGGGGAAFSPNRVTGEGAQ